MGCAGVSTIVEKFIVLKRRDVEQLCCV